MTGLTPVSRVFCQSWTAPAIEPWSVRLTAGISSSAARLTRSGIRHAPSRIEYSEWTWRWTNSDGGIAEGSVYAGPRRAPSSPFRRSFGAVKNYCCAMRRGAALFILFFVFAPAAHAACGQTQTAVSGEAPLKVTFTAVCTSSVYSWSFGDGATAVGQTVTHTFRAGHWQPALQTDAGAERGRPVTSIALRLSAPRVARYGQYVVLHVSVVPRLPVTLRGRRFGLKGKLRVRVLSAHPWVATAGGPRASAQTL